VRWATTAPPTVAVPRVFTETVRLGPRGSSGLGPQGGGFRVEGSACVLYPPALYRTPKRTPHTHAFASGCWCGRKRTSLASVMVSCASSACCLASFSRFRRVSDLRSMPCGTIACAIRLPCQVPPASGPCLAWRGVVGAPRVQSTGARSRKRHGLTAGGKPFTVAPFDPSSTSWI
jgi:hypothetical protein